MTAAPVRRLLFGALFALALLTLAGRGAPVQAQVLPPPPTVPAPPEEGSPASDLLGPALTDTCDNASVVFALAGPIASAQLPEELQALVSELEPYIGTALIACGFVATPPSGIVCSADEGVGNQFATFGLPVAAPTGAQVVHDTIAGIESAFLRVGVDVGRDTSTELAAALGCSVAEPDALPPPAALPPTPALAPSPAASGPVSPTAPAAVGGIAAAPGRPAAPPAVVSAPSTVPATEQSAAGPVATVSTVTPVPTGLVWNPLTYVLPLVLLLGLAWLGRAFTEPVRHRGGTR